MNEKKILIVSDNENLRYSLSNILSEFGYCVLNSNDQNHSKISFDHENPDLVVLDMQNPGIKEIEFFKVISNNNKNGNGIRIGLEEFNKLNDIPSLAVATKEVEKEIIKQALLKSAGNKIKASKMLQMNRKTLYRKMKKFDIKTS
jgi:DNA-binding NtrC family response regulator